MFCHQTGVCGLQMSHTLLTCHHHVSGFRLYSRKSDVSATLEGHWLLVAVMSTSYCQSDMLLVPTIVTALCVDEVVGKAAGATKYLAPTQMSVAECCCYCTYKFHLRVELC